MIVLKRPHLDYHQKKYLYFYATVKKKNSVGEKEIEAHFRYQLHKYNEMCTVNFTDFECFINSSIM